MIIFLRAHFGIECEIKISIHRIQPISELIKVIVIDIGPINDGLFSFFFFFDIGPLGYEDTVKGTSHARPGTGANCHDYKPSVRHTQDLP